ncbi:MAG TPA: hypothetical protein VF543_15690 [Pyrinomonadaceae bacterium]
MTNLKIYVLLVILLMPLMAIAQDGRDLISRIEHETLSSEPACRLMRKSANEMGGMMQWECGKYRILMNVYIADSTDIAHEWYMGMGSKSSSKTGSFDELDEFGDEGIFIKDYLKQGSAALIFRKGTIIIQTVGDSEEAIQRFAKYALKQIASV